MSRLDSTATSLSGMNGGLAFDKRSGDWIFTLGAASSRPAYELNDAGFQTDADRIRSSPWAAGGGWQPARSSARSMPAVIAPRPQLRRRQCGPSLSAHVDGSFNCSGAVGWISATGSGRSTTRPRAAAPDQHVRRVSTWEGASGPTAARPCRSRGRLRHRRSSRGPAAAASAADLDTVRRAPPTSRSRRATCLPLRPVLCDPGADPTATATYGRPLPLQRRSTRTS